MPNKRGLEGYLKWSILWIPALIATVTSILFSAPVFAASNGSVCASFTVVNPPPEVVDVRLFQVDHQTPAATMSADNSFWLDIEVQDSSLADIKSLRVVLFYSTVTNEIGTVPAFGDSTTSAIVVWSKGNYWNSMPTIDAGADDTWNITEYKTPSENASQGKWSLKFQPGRLAKPTGLAGKKDSWNIAVQVVDSGNNIATSGNTGYSMAALIKKDYQVSWFF